MILVEQTDILFWTINLVSFRYVITKAIKYCLVHPKRSHRLTNTANLKECFNREFIRISQDAVKHQQNGYTYAFDSTLCIDGRKHKSRPYIIIMPFNVIYEIHTVVIVNIRCFKDRIISYPMSKMSQDTF
jgi:hypothetical protein